MTASRNAASLGSVSHGTLRNQDLIESFSSKLEWLEGPDDDLVLEAKAVDTLFSFGWTEIYGTEEASCLMEALMEALNEHAPAYCYFGTHEGDGSDFGFWPCIQMIDELPRVSDPAEVEKMSEDCVYVNDHGNMTVYGRDGSVLMECV
jgi:hypothetical protein